MNNSRLLLTCVLGLVLLLQISTIRARTDVPVLIWGGDVPATPNKILVNPFEKTSEEDFVKIVTKFVGGSLKPLLVFVKEDLCVEDLAESKESLRSLLDIGSLVYRPTVSAAVSVFEKLPYYNFTTEEDLDSLTEGQLNLRKVSNLEGIVKTYNGIKESSPNLVAALTGASCRYARPDRIKRAVTEEPTAAPPSQEIKINGSKILMYASSQPILELLDEKDSEITLSNYGPEGNGTLETPLQVNFEYTIKGNASGTANILLRFPKRYVGYHTPEVLFVRNDENTTLKTSTDASFPDHFSYHCSQSIEFATGNVKFRLTDFQVQIDAPKFGDAYDCVGFMSIPIWAGIFVTAILAIIMIWGLSMVMDIRTPDRYDDPKGKTITINASVD